MLFVVAVFRVLGDILLRASGLRVELSGFRLRRSDFGLRFNPRGPELPDI